MLPRFLAAIDVTSGTARLAGDEARHLAQVLRLGSGDEVVIFDGAGHEFRGRVEQVARDGASIRLIEAHAAAPEPSVRVTLAQAALKGEKMDDVVRDATMMGVVAIEPLVTSHTAAHLKPGRAPARWRRIAIASAKQCRRAVVPHVGEGTTLGDWLARDGAQVKFMLVEPGAAPDAAHHHLRLSPSSPLPISASVLIGPEGGWSADEIAAGVAAGCTPVTLGARTLRADAVPVVALSVLQYLWGDL